jgi:O-antigen ligase
LPLPAYFIGIALVHLPFLLAAVLWIKDSGAPFWADGYRLAHFANVRQYAEFGFFAASGASAAGMLSRRLAVPSVLLAFAGVFGLILTGSRGALLAWTTFIVLCTFFNAARWRVVIHGAMALTAAAVLVWYLDHSGSLPSPNIFARVASEHLGQETFDNSRLALWRMSWQQILVHPLFGSGPEGYWLSGCCNPRIMQAHNFVLQFLMEFGAAGCAVALLLMARAVMRLGGVAATARSAMAVPGNKVLSCLVAAFLAYSLVDQTMYHVVPLLHFALIAGLWAAGLSQARVAATRNLSEAA